MRIQPLQVESAYQITLEQNNEMSIANVCLEGLLRLSLPLTISPVRVLRLSLSLLFFLANGGLSLLLSFSLILVCSELRIMLLFYNQGHLNGNAKTR